MSGDKINNNYQFLTNLWYIAIFLSESNRLSFLVSLLIGKVEVLLILWVLVVRYVHEVKGSSYGFCWSIFLLDKRIHKIFFHHHNHCNPEYANQSFQVLFKLFLGDLDRHSQSLHSEKLQLSQLLWKMSRFHRFHYQLFYLSLWNVPSLALNI